MSAPRVIVVGAGPAGVRAVETLVTHGLAPTVIDEAPAAGGQIYRRQPAGFRRSLADIHGFEAGRAGRLHAAFDALAGKIDYRPKTQVWTVAGTRILTLRDGRAGDHRFDALILATGARDRVMPFRGWTLPGVYTLGGAQVALKHQGCAIGARTIFVGGGPLLYLVAYQYAKAGAGVAAVIDGVGATAKLRALPRLAAGRSTLAKGLYYVAWLRAHGVRVIEGALPEAVAGADAVEGLRLRDRRGRAVTVAGDAIATGFGLEPETRLADLAGCDFRFDAGDRLWLPETDGEGRSSVAGIYLAGDGARIAGALAAEITGERAARALLADFGQARDPARDAVLRRRLGRLDRFRAALAHAFPYPHQAAAAMADAVMLCRCEAIAAGALRAAVRDLGCDDLNRAKAFTRIGMGRCQGRFCATAAAEVLAATSGRDLAAVGRPRGQAPAKPVPLTAGADQ